MRHTTKQIGAGLLASVLMWGPLVAPQVLAPQGVRAAEMMKKKLKDIPVELEPWPGRRVVLLLPLQLGAGFNADRQFGKLILPRAEAELASALEATGKFSVLRVHRFSPLVQRGLQEKRVTEEQVRSVIAEPVNIDSAMAFLSQYTFDQTPMIADFRLEEVRSSVPAMAPKMGMKMKNGTTMKSGTTMKNGGTTDGGMIVDGMMNNGTMSKPLMMGDGMPNQKMTNNSKMSKSSKMSKGSKLMIGVPSVQAQVSGRLYQAGESIAYKAPVVTSMSVQTGRNNIERYLLAASDAFTRIATEFTAPLEDIVLPQAPIVNPTSVENATTPITSDTSTAVTTPDPKPDDTSSPIPLPPDIEDNAPIVAPVPDNPAQGNPIPGNAPVQAQ